jgi:hypothetical protein
MATYGIQEAYICTQENKNTTQYVLQLDTTICKHEPSYKQLEVKTNRTSFYAEMVTDIMLTQNLEYKDI